MERIKYRTLFDLYGETEDLTTDYISDLIRGSVTFDEYNSERIAREYLIRKYGLDKDNIDGHAWRLCNLEIDNFDWLINLGKTPSLNVTISSGSASISYANIWSARWIPSKVGVMSLRNNRIKSILGLGDKLKSSFPNLGYLSLCGNPIPDEEWAIELHKMKHIAHVGVPSHIYTEFLSTFPNLW